MWPSPLNSLPLTHCLLPSPLTSGGSKSTSHTPDSCYTSGQCARLRAFSCSHMWPSPLNSLPLTHCLLPSLPSHQVGASRRVTRQTPAFQVTQPKRARHHLAPAIDDEEGGQWCLDISKGIFSHISRATNLGLDPHMHPFMGFHQILYMCA